MPVTVIGGTALMYLNYLADALNIRFEKNIMSHFNSFLHFKDGEQTNNVN